MFPTLVRISHGLMMIKTSGSHLVHGLKMLEIHILVDGCLGRSLICSRGTCGPFGTK